MQGRDSIAVRNRFDALANDNQSATEKYEHFIVANQEVTQELVPELPGRKSELLNKHPRVVQAREKSRAVYRKYQPDPTEENRLSFEDAKREIDNSYAIILEEQLEGKIKEIEQADKTVSMASAGNLLMKSVAGRHPPKASWKVTLRRRE